MGSDIGDRIGGDELILLLGIAIFSVVLYGCTDNYKVIVDGEIYTHHTSKTMCELEAAQIDTIFRSSGRTGHAVTCEYRK